MPNLLIKERPNSIPYRDLYDKEQAGPVVDLGVDLEGYHGAVYLKFKDAKAIGAIVGMIPKEEADEMRKRIAELEVRVGALPKLAEGFIDGINSNVDSFLSGLTAVTRSVDAIKSLESEKNAGTSGGTAIEQSAGDSKNSKGNSLSGALGI